MILRSDPRARRAGFSLLEVLVVLAITTMVVGALSFRARGPSPRQQAEQAAARAQARVAELRYHAIVQNRSLHPEGLPAPCEATDARLRLWPDGSISGPDLCPEPRSVGLRLVPEPLTGRLRLEAVQ